MDRTDIIIRRVEAVAAYLNDDCDIVIRQINSMGDDDGVIVIPPQCIQALVDRLLLLMGETEAGLRQ